MVMLLPPLRQGGYPTRPLSGYLELTSADVAEIYRIIELEIGAKVKLTSPIYPAPYTQVFAETIAQKLRRQLSCVISVRYARTGC